MAKHFFCSILLLFAHDIVMATFNPPENPVPHDDNFDDQPAIEDYLLLHVLNNNDHVGSSNLTIVFDTDSPINGQITLDGLGPAAKIKYTPHDSCYEGPDTFTYQLQNGVSGELSAPATVTLTLINGDSLLPQTPIFLDFSFMNFHEYILAWINTDVVMPFDWQNIFKTVGNANDFVLAKQEESTLNSTNIRPMFSGSARLVWEPLILADGEQVNLN